jgi:ABC-type multidrug transport system fused ATPase/permease subunit
MHATGGSSLAATLAAWNPRFRRIRVALVVLALAAGFTVFAENSVLATLSLSIRQEAMSNAHRTNGGMRSLVPAVSERAGALGLSLPLAMLLLFIALRLARIGADASGRMLMSRLQIRSRAEIEAEVLAHLQRQGDDFFGTRPIAEILSRLSADVDRALEARDATIRLFRLTVMIAGNLYFFILQDWRLAFAGILTCALGALWMDRMAWPVGRTEKLLLERDERVRAHFEDLLRAAPEVQVSNLFQQSRAYMGKAQEDREPVYTRVAWLDARLNAVQGISALVGMSSLFVVTLYFLASQSPEAGVALVPIILKALPELFTNASAVVMQRLSLARAQTSIQRLLEFDSPEEHEEYVGIEASTPAPLRFENVTYQYPSPLGIPQGGIQGISTEFVPGRWIAIVGPTGAGKTTLLQLLLGRLQPQAGTVFHGHADLRKVSPEARAAIHSFMPQRVSILDATIGENVTFGRERRDGDDLPPSDLAVLDAAGLSDICRRKALDMVPRADEITGELGRRILHLRAQAWRQLDRLDIWYRKYGSGPGDPQHWVLEHLLEGRCSRSATIDRILSADARRPLRRILTTPLGEILLQHGQQTLQACRSLLRLSTYQQFVRLSPFYLDERTWQLWTATQNMAEASVTSKAEAAMIISVALMSPAGEAGTPWKPRPEWSVGIATLRSLLGPLCAPFREAAIHPFMTWRENLMFGTVEVRNDRMEQRVEQALLDLLEAEGLTDAFTQVGLRFSVGRGGTRLSGGQGQLLALCRTLLRNTPVVVLDEPTSALDPASRSRVAALLHEVKKGRIVITSSHDPDFVREADEVRLIERGRLVRSGPVEELLKDSKTLRNLLRIEPGRIPDLPARRAL